MTPTIFPSILPDDDSADDQADSVEPSPIDPSTMTVAELRDALDDRAHDWTAPKLRGVREAEREGDNRETALTAIDAAIAEAETEG